MKKNKRAWGNMANIPNPQALFGALRETDLSFFFLFSTKDLFNQRARETTFTFHVCNLPPQDESEKVVKQSPCLVRRKKTLEIHTDWIKSKIKVSVAVGVCTLHRAFFWPR